MLSRWGFLIYRLLLSLLGIDTPYRQQITEPAQGDALASSLSPLPGWFASGSEFKPSAGELVRGEDTTLWLCCLDDQSQKPSTVIWRWFSLQGCQLMFQGLSYSQCTVGLRRRLHGPVMISHPIRDLRLDGWEMLNPYEQIPASACVTAYGCVW